MSHYKSNLRDIEFNLFEVFGRGEVYGTGEYADMDADTAKSILAEVERLAVDELAPSLLDSDRNPPIFHPETNSATLPESFKRSYKQFMDAEWWRLGLPVELGGTPTPRTLRWSVAELVLGANPAIWMYSSGADFATVVWNLGTEEQRKVARHMVEGQWGSTMVLTEPDAGSDVGAGRAKAIQQADGTWHIEGVKRFITSGEHDLSENIIHLVLARPEGAGPGTKGLSLFIVPKFDFDWETGELGERNGAFVTNVEHKMGLKASTTCEVTFGQAGVPAKGWLLGEVHDGIAQMFNIIEFARMMVGTKAISTLSTGYLNALEYAKQRVQGADLATTGKDAPRVTITHHPDVRRSLMTQKAYVEGMRSLVLYTATFQDAIEQARAAGTEDKNAERMNDLLLPIVKGYGSEKSYEQLAQALQIFGGSGFLQEYPLEQYIRDAKIDSLYEGTTAIQSLDLFFRKIVKDGGVALNGLNEEITKFLAADPGGAELARERQLLATAQAEVGAMLKAMLDKAGESLSDSRQLYVVAQNTVRFLFALGDVIVSWLLLRGATVAQAALADGAAGRDVPFYTGKVAAAKFFAQNTLPLLAAQRAIVEATDNALMDVPEEAF
ncbi:alkylation response protein AidB-like acyl-CoA dehydrogenase [Catenulispora sp. GP43]|uniref:acyl-CoA dehydrogenase n=1 Tax=Catenulispora sp. GP43 TaxID=3156263 RepID=UPI00351886F2